MNIELLSRVQFGATVAFHYIFPPLSIGLGLMMVIMEAMWLRTRNPKYFQMTKFWTKIFGLIFAVGVASGIVMEFQFGTNWSAYSRFVGDVFGSALAAEGIFAFFLESGFLAVVLFGWTKVKPATHFFATCMVALGAHFSAVWIVVANSWQQTPAGYHLVETASGTRAEITNFWEVVFNPSSMDRLVHVILGAYLAAAFFVLSVSAYYLLRGKHVEIARTGLKLGLIVATLSALAQAISGDSSGGIVTKYQPAKLAAFEGLYTTQTKAPAYVFGWVDEKNERVVGLGVPGLLSLMAKKDFNAEITGLDAFKPEERPPVQAVFQSYHLMVALGGAMIGLSLLGMLFWWRGWLFDMTWGLPRFYLWILVFAVLLPQFANQAGWFSAEVGRQPWVVQGLLLTSKGLSESVVAGEVWFSLILFGFIYSLLFALFIFLLDRKIKQGPITHAEENISAKRHLPFETGDR